MSGVGVGGQLQEGVWVEGGGLQGERTVRSLSFHDWWHGAKLWQKRRTLPSAGRDLLACLYQIDQSLGLWNPLKVVVCLSFSALPGLPEDPQRQRVGFEFTLQDRLLLGIRKSTAKSRLLPHPPPPSAGRRQWKREPLFSLGILSCLCLAVMPRAGAPHLHLEDTANGHSPWDPGEVKSEL